MARSYQAGAMVQGRMGGEDTFQLDRPVGAYWVAFRLIMPVSTRQKDPRAPVRRRNHDRSMEVLHAAQLAR